MVKPLEYNVELTLEEAGDRLNEVIREFNKVRSHNFGLFRKVKEGKKGNLAEGDNQLLVDCVGVLLPLSMKSPVQDEISQKKYEDTLHYKITRIQDEIMNYLTNFSNTGVERIAVDSGLT